MRGLITIVVLLAVCVCASIARAQNCDPAFKGMEFYYCVVDLKEVQVGLEKEDVQICIENKKLEPKEGCAFGPFTYAGKFTGLKSQFVYAIGTTAQKNKIGDYSWQCDPSSEGADYVGGMDTKGFDGNWHPNYGLDKFPGEDKNARDKRFYDDLEKKGKTVVLSIQIYNQSETSQPEARVNKQICQFYNAKTNTIAAKFSANKGGK